MDAKSRVILVLAALVAVLIGALIFLAGRMTAPEAAPIESAPKPPPTAAPIPAQGDSSTGGGKDPAEAPAPVAPPPAAAEDPRTIPAAFLGDWNQEIAHCGTGLNDSAMRVEPRVLRFYESRGDVTRVTRTGERAVSVEARFQGEGDTWTETVPLTLSPAGDTLTTGQDAPRRRCPS